VAINVQPHIYCASFLLGKWVVCELYHMLRLKLHFDLRVAEVPFSCIRMEAGDF